MKNPSPLSQLYAPLTPHQSRSASVFFGAFALATAAVFLLLFTGCTTITSKPDGTVSFSSSSSKTRVTGFKSPAMSWTSFGTDVSAQFQAIIQIAADAYAGKLEAEKQVAVEKALRDDAEKRAAPAPVAGP